MFRWEQDLQDSFLAQARSELWAPRARFDTEQILEECSWSDGRADAVWAGFQGSFTYCENLAGTLADHTVSRIVAELRFALPCTESRLIAAAGVGLGTFRSALYRAMDVGLITQTQSGSFLLGPAFPEVSVEICAFEFKLRDWKRALYQAARYRAFSHRVYVVMPSNATKRPSEFVHLFHTFGIGLIEHDPDGRSRRLTLARKQKPRSRPSFVRAIAEFADPDLEPGLPAKELDRFCPVV